MHRREGCLNAFQREVILIRIAFLGLRPVERPFEV